jgi:hypothetical protein
VKKDFAVIAKNAQNVAAGSAKANANAILSITTQIYYLNRSINIFMIECVCEKCSCEHHCETECFECQECGKCACEHCKEKEVRGDN